MSVRAYTRADTMYLGYSILQEYDGKERKQLQFKQAYLSMRWSCNTVTINN